MFDPTSTPPLYAVLEMQDAMSRRNAPPETFMRRNGRGSFSQLAPLVEARRQIVSDMYCVDVRRADIMRVTGVSQQLVTNYIVQCREFYKPPCINRLYAAGDAEYVAVKWRNKLCREMSLGLEVFDQTRTKWNDCAARRAVYARMREAGFGYAAIGRACGRSDCLVSQALSYKAVAA
jgi:hypothetical protein